MRKIYSGLFFLLASGIPAILFSQQITVNPKQVYARPNHQVGVGPEVLCNVDTVAYPEYKATAFVLLNVNNTNSARAMYQYYDCPQEMLLKGATFFAYAPNQPNPVNIVMKIYLASPDSIPMGAPIAMDTVPVDSSAGNFLLSDIERHATFPNPVTVNQAYIVVFENHNPQSVSIVCSDYEVNDGDGEWLSGANFPQTPAAWVRGYDVNVGAFDFDADVILLPHAEYDLQAAFIADSTCLNLTDTVCFTNISAPLMQNRMYNQYAFLNIPGSSFAWDYGDGSGLNYNNGICHYYSGNGPYTVYLYANHFGWFISCGANTSMDVGVPGLPVAGFNAAVSGITVNFTSTSSGAATWSWDLGDGTTSTVPNPTHVYAGNGTYPILLIITNGCGADTLLDSVVINCTPPSAGFTWNHSFLNASFTNTSSGGSSYQWAFGDGGTSLASNPNHIYPAYGSYLVTLIVFSNCGNDTITDSVHIQQPVSLTGPAPAWNVIMKPNPANSMATVQFAPIGERASLVLSDLHGRVWKVIPVTEGMNEVEIELVNVPSGVYLVELTAPSGRWVSRLSVAH